MQYHIFLYAVIQFYTAEY